MHFYSSVFATDTALSLVPCKHFCSHFRPFLAVVACSAPFPLSGVWVKVVGHAHFCRRIQVRIGAMGIPHPFYLGEHAGVVEGYPTGYPRLVASGFAVILLVDRSYPLTCLLGEPAFHSLEGV